MKLGALLREIEGKNMEIGWIGSIHWCKWTVEE